MSLWEPISNARSYFAYDMIAELAFGEPLGFVKRGVDVNQLIKKFHDMAPFAGFVAALPWIAKIFTSNPLGRYIFMPKPGDNTGTGQIMAVSTGTLHFSLLLVLKTNYHYRYIV